MKVILIGNSPSVLNFKKGTEIDSFDIVVRLNDFETSGFEDCVGNKTDILITNASVNRKVVDVSSFKEIFVCCRSFQRNFQGIKNYIPKNVLDETDLIFNKFNKNIVSNKCPSTGLYSCIFLYKKYGHIKIHGLNGLSNPSHYYDKSYPMDLTNHDPISESNTYEYFKSNGLIGQL